MRLAPLLLLALVLHGCTTKGSGKATTPAWKVYQEKHPVAAPSAPVRSGAQELRITEAYLEENKTVFAVSHWVARIRCSIVSTEKLPVSTLSDAFTITGRSGKTYKAHFSTRGPARRTWQHQEHTGEPTHLPAGVAGELEVWVQVGDDKTHDELAGFAFRGIQVPLGR